MPLSLLSIHCLHHLRALFVGSCPPCWSSHNCCCPPPYLLTTSVSSPRVPNMCLSSGCLAQCPAQVPLPCAWGIYSLIPQCPNSVNCHTSSVHQAFGKYSLIVPTIQGRSTLFYFIFYLSETGSYCGFPQQACISLGKAGWPQTHRALSACICLSSAGVKWHTHP